MFNTHLSKSPSVCLPTNYQTFQLSQAADGTSSCPFLPILLPRSDFCRPAHMQEHQRTLRIEHSWHCWAYIFHTQATVLQNTPAPSCPISSSGTGGASFPPSPSAFEPFFTSVAGPRQARRSDKNPRARSREFTWKGMCSENRSMSEEIPVFLFSTRTLPYFC